MPISGAASLHVSCCCPFKVVLLTINFLVVCTIWAFPSKRDVHIYLLWPPIKVRDEPAMWPPIGVMTTRERPKREDNKWDEQKTFTIFPALHTFRSYFERTAKYKKWPIRQLGGEAILFPYLMLWAKQRYHIGHQMSVAALLAVFIELTILRCAADNRRTILALSYRPGVHYSYLTTRECYFLMLTSPKSRDPSQNHCIF